MEITKDDTVSSDLKKLVVSCLKKCVRKDVEEDTRILADIGKGDNNEKKEKKKPNESQSSALQLLNDNLDDFLAMYEDEDEENGEDTSSKESSLLPEFTCCLCHSNEYDSKENVPCLLCHIAPNSVHCMLIMMDNHCRCYKTP